MSQKVAIALLALGVFAGARAQAAVLTFEGLTAQGAEDITAFNQG